MTASGEKEKGPGEKNSWGLAKKTWELSGSGEKKGSMAKEEW